MSSTEAPPFRIREYLDTDFPYLCYIDQACFPETIAYTPEEIALGLAQRGAFALVAQKKNHIIGFILASHQKRPVGHIITIDVLPDFRKLGIGSRLMMLAEQRLKEDQADRIALEVSVHNESAIRFYRTLGYTAKRLLREYYPDHSNAYLMEKSLQL